MNKEQQELIDEVYNNYTTSKAHPLDGKYGDTSVRKLNHMYPYEPILSQEEFTNKCKTDTEFSKKWGLKIEERELSPKERIELGGGRIQEKYPALVEMSLRVCDERDIPTKLITITYDKTIESYE